MYRASRGVGVQIEAERRGVPIDLLGGHGRGRVRAEHAFLPRASTEELRAGRIDAGVVHRGVADEQFEAGGQFQERAQMPATILRSPRRAAFRGMLKPEFHRRFEIGRAEEMVFAHGGDVGPALDPLAACAFAVLLAIVVRHRQGDDAAFDQRAAGEARSGLRGDGLRQFRQRFVAAVQARQALADADGRAFVPGDAARRCQSGAIGVERRLIGLVREGLVGDVDEPVVLVGERGAAARGEKDGGEHGRGGEGRRAGFPVIHVGRSPLEGDGRRLDAR